MSTQRLARSVRTTDSNTNGGWLSYWSLLWAQPGATQDGVGRWCKQLVDLPTSGTKCLVQRGTKCNWIRANVRQSPHSKAFIPSWPRSLSVSNSWTATPGLVFPSVQNASLMWARSLCVGMWTRGQRVHVWFLRCMVHIKHSLLEVSTLVTRGASPNWWAMLGALVWISPKSDPVMVNFVCQLDWTTGCPDIWLDVILSILWGYFGIILTYKLVDWVKQIALYNVGGPHPFSWSPEYNKTLTFPWVIENSPAQQPLHWRIDSSWACSSLPAFGLELQHLLCRF